PCFAWDLPGYGESAPLSESWPLPEDYAVALERWLGPLGPRKVVVVGHSLGALIAARFAATRAARTQALVLISPAAGYGVARGASLPGQAARVRSQARCRSCRRSPPPRVPKDRGPFSAPAWRGGGFIQRAHSAAPLSMPRAQRTAPQRRRAALAAAHDRRPL